MSQPGGERAVHSIVCALPDASALRGSAASGTVVMQRLAALAAQALAQGRASAENVVEIDFGIAASFLNSGAALSFVRVLQHLAGGADGLPVRIGVHMGSLEAGDPQLGSRAPLRLARQVALLARPGQACASAMFHNFVTQFDHRCKSCLHAAPPLVSAQGHGVQVYEIRFDELPPLAETSERRSARATDPLALPVDAEARQSFLGRAETLLAEEIGPLARLIIRQAAETTHTRAAFYRTVGESLPPEIDRAAFFRALDRA
jgi:hypothetical protein